MSTRRSRPALRAISMIVAAAFIAQDSGLAMIDLTAKPMADPANVTVPHETGIVRETFTGDGPRTVINIKDVHDNYLAQDSIVRLLENLVTQYQVRTIGIEGYQGFLDPSLLAALPDPKLRRNTADHLLRQGTLSAGEFFAAMNGGKVAVYGMDDEALYRENLDAFKKNLTSQKVHLDRVARLLSALALLKERVYSPELAELDRNGIMDERSGTKFSDRWTVIAAMADRAGIPYEKYPNISKLLKAREAERGVDFAGAGEERKRLVERLTRLPDRDKLEAVLAESIAYKLGQRSQAAFSSYLLDRADEAGIDGGAFARLRAYADYMALFETIDIESIKDEVRDLEDLIRDKVFRNDAERRLFALSRQSEILRDIFEMKLSSASLAFYRAHLADFSAQGFKEFLSANGRDGLEGDVDALFAALPEAARFYDAVEARNQALMQNTVDRMRENGENVACLVTGGFHSRGIADLLKEDRVSYVVIVPRFAKNAERPYITVLTSQKGSFREMVRSEEALEVRMQMTAHYFAQVAFAVAKKNDNASDAQKDRLIQEAIREAKARYAEAVAAMRGRYEADGLLAYGAAAVVDAPASASEAVPGSAPGVSKPLSSYKMIAKSSENYLAQVAGLATAGMPLTSGMQVAYEGRTTYVLFVIDGKNYLFAASINNDGELTLTRWPGRTSDGVKKSDLKKFKEIQGKIRSGQTTTVTVEEARRIQAIRTIQSRDFKTVGELEAELRRLGLAPEVFGKDYETILDRVRARAAAAAVAALPRTSPAATPAAKGVVTPSTTAATATTPVTTPAEAAPTTPAGKAISTAPVITVTTPAMAPAAADASDATKAKNVQDMRTVAERISQLYKLRDTGKFGEFGYELYILLMDHTHQDTGLLDLNELADQLSGLAKVERDQLLEWLKQAHIGFQITAIQSHLEAASKKLGEPDGLPAAMTLFRKAMELAAQSELPNQLSDVRASIALMARQNERFIEVLNAFGADFDNPVDQVTCEYLKLIAKTSFSQDGIPGYVDFRPQLRADLNTQAGAWFRANEAEVGSAIKAHEDALVAREEANAKTHGERIALRNKRHMYRRRANQSFTAIFKDDREHQRGTDPRQVTSPESKLLRARLQYQMSLKRLELFELDDSVMSVEQKEAELERIQDEIESAYEKAGEHISYEASEYMAFNEYGSALRSKESVERERVGMILHWDHLLAEAAHQDALDQLKNKDKDSEGQLSASGKSSFEIMMDRMKSEEFSGIQNPEASGRLDATLEAEVKSGRVTQEELDQIRDAQKSGQDGKSKTWREAVHEVLSAESSQYAETIRNGNAEIARRIEQLKDQIALGANDEARMTAKREMTRLLNRMTGRDFVMNMAEHGYAGTLAAAQTALDSARLRSAKLRVWHNKCLHDLSGLSEQELKDRGLDLDAEGLTPEQTRDRVAELNKLMLEKSAHSGAMIDDALQLDHLDATTDEGLKEFDERMQRILLNLDKVVVGDVERDATVEERNKKLAYMFYYARTRLEASETVVDERTKELRQANSAFIKVMDADKKSGGKILNIHREYKQAIDEIGSGFSQFQGLVTQVFENAKKGGVGYEDFKDKSWFALSLVQQKQVLEEALKAAKQIIKDNSTASADLQTVLHMMKALDLDEIELISIMREGRGRGQQAAKEPYQLLEHLAPMLTNVLETSASGLNEYLTFMIRDRADLNYYAQEGQWNFMLNVAFNSFRAMRGGRREFVRALLLQAGGGKETAFAAGMIAALMANARMPKGTSEIDTTNSPIQIVDGEIRVIDQDLFNERMTKAFVMAGADAANLVTQAAGNEALYLAQRKGIRIFALRQKKLVRITSELVEKNGKKEIQAKETEVIDLDGGVNGSKAQSEDSINEYGVLDRKKLEALSGIYYFVGKDVQGMIASADTPSTGNDVAKQLALGFLGRIGAAAADEVHAFINSNPLILGATPDESLNIRAGDIDSYVKMMQQTWSMNLLYAKIRKQIEEFKKSPPVNTGRGRFNIVSAENVQDFIRNCRSDPELREAFNAAFPEDAVTDEAILSVVESAVSIMLKSDRELQFKDAVYTVRSQDSAAPQKDTILGSRFEAIFATIRAAYEHELLVYGTSPSDFLRSPRLFRYFNKVIDAFAHDTSFSVTPARALEVIGGANVVMGSATLADIPQTMAGVRTRYMVQITPEDQLDADVRILARLTRGGWKSTIRRIMTQYLFDRGAPLHSMLYSDKSEGNLTEFYAEALDEVKYQAVMKGLRYLKDMGYLEGMDEAGLGQLYAEKFLNVDAKDLTLDSLLEALRVEDFEAEEREALSKRMAGGLVAGLLIRTEEGDERQSLIYRFEGGRFVELSMNWDDADKYMKDHFKEKAENQKEEDTPKTLVFGMGVSEGWNGFGNPGGRAGVIAGEMLPYNKLVQLSRRANTAQRAKGYVFQVINVEDITQMTQEERQEVAALQSRPDLQRALLIEIQRRMLAESDTSNHLQVIQDRARLHGTSRTEHEARTREIQVRLWNRQMSSRDSAGTPMDRRERESFIIPGEPPTPPAATDTIPPIPGVITSDDDRKKRLQAVEQYFVERGLVDPATGFTTIEGRHLFSNALKLMDTKDPKTLAAIYERLKALKNSGRLTLSTAEEAAFKALEQVMQRLRIGANADVLTDSFDGKPAQIDTETAIYLSGLMDRAGLIRLDNPVYRNFETFQNSVAPVLWAISQTFSDKEVERRLAAVDPASILALRSPEFMSQQDEIDDPALATERFAGAMNLYFGIRVTRQEREKIAEALKTVRDELKKQEKELESLQEESDKLIAKPKEYQALQTARRRRVEARIEELKLQALEAFDGVDQRLTELILKKYPTTGDPLAHKSPQALDQLNQVRLTILQMAGLQDRFTRRQEGMLNDDELLSVIQSADGRPSRLGEAAQGHLKTAPDEIARRMGKGMLIRKNGLAMTAREFREEMEKAPNLAALLAEMETDEMIAFLKDQKVITDQEAEEIEKNVPVKRDPRYLSVVEKLVGSIATAGDKDRLVKLTRELLKRLPAAAAVRVAVRKFGLSGFVPENIDRSDKASTLIAKNALHSAGQRAAFYLGVSKRAEDRALEALNLASERAVRKAARAAIKHLAGKGVDLNQPDVTADQAIERLAAPAECYTRRLLAREGAAASEADVDLAIALDASVARHGALTLAALDEAVRPHLSSSDADLSAVDQLKDDANRHMRELIGQLTGLTTDMIAVAVKTRGQLSLTDDGEESPAAIFADRLSLSRLAALSNVAVRVRAIRNAAPDRLLDREVRAFLKEEGLGTKMDFAAVLILAGVQNPVEIVAFDDLPVDPKRGVVNRNNEIVKEGDPTGTLSPLTSDKDAEIKTKEVSDEAQFKEFSETTTHLRTRLMLHARFEHWADRLDTAHRTAETFHRRIGADMTIDRLNAYARDTSEKYKEMTLVEYIQASPYLAGGDWRLVQAMNGLKKKADERIQTETDKRGPGPGGKPRKVDYPILIDEFSRIAMDYYVSLYGPIRLDNRDRNQEELFRNKIQPLFEFFRMFRPDVQQDDWNHFSGQLITLEVMENLRKSLITDANADDRTTATLTTSTWEIFDWEQMLIHASHKSMLITEEVDASQMTVGSTYWDADHGIRQLLPTLLKDIPQDRWNGLWERLAKLDREKRKVLDFEGLLKILGLQTRTLELAGERKAIERALERGAMMHVHRVEKGPDDAYRIASVVTTGISDYNAATFKEIDRAVDAPPGREAQLTPEKPFIAPSGKVLQVRAVPGAKGLAYERYSQRETKNVFGRESGLQALIPEMVEEKIHFDLHARELSKLAATRNDPSLLIGDISLMTDAERADLERRLSGTFDAVAAPLVKNALTLLRRYINARGRYEARLGEIKKAYREIKIPEEDKFEGREFAPWISDGSRLNVDSVFMTTLMRQLQQYYEEAERREASLGKSAMIAKLALVDIYCDTTPNRSDFANAKNMQAVPSATAYLRDALVLADRVTALPRSVAETLKRLEALGKDADYDTFIAAAYATDDGKPVDVRIDDDTRSKIEKLLSERPTTSFESTIAIANSFTEKLVAERVQEWIAAARAQRAAGRRVPTSDGISQRWLRASLTGYQHESGHETPGTNITDAAFRMERRADRRIIIGMLAYAPFGFQEPLPQHDYDIRNKAAAIRASIESDAADPQVAMDFVWFLELTEAAGDLSQADRPSQAARWQKELESSDLVQRRKVQKEIADRVVSEFVRNVRRDGEVSTDLRRQRIIAAWRAPRRGDKDYTSRITNEIYEPLANVNLMGNSRAETVMNFASNYYLRSIAGDPSGYLVPDEILARNARESFERMPEYRLLPRGDIDATVQEVVDIHRATHGNRAGAVRPASGSLFAARRFAEAELFLLLLQNRLAAGPPDPKDPSAIEEILLQLQAASDRIQGQGNVPLQLAHLARSVTTTLQAFSLTSGRFGELAGVGGVLSALPVPPILMTGIYVALNQLMTGGLIDRDGADAEARKGLQKSVNGAFQALSVGDWEEFEAIANQFMDDTRKDGGDSVRAATERRTAVDRVFGDPAKGRTLRRIPSKGVLKRIPLFKSLGTTASMPRTAAIQKGLQDILHPVSPHIAGQTPEDHDRQVAILDYAKRKAERFIRDADLDPGAARTLRDYLSLEELKLSSGALTYRDLPVRRQSILRVDQVIGELIESKAAGREQGQPSPEQQILAEIGEEMASALWQAYRMKEADAAAPNVARLVSAWALTGGNYQKEKLGTETRDHELLLRLVLDSGTPTDPSDRTPAHELSSKLASDLEGRFSDMFGLEWSTVGQLQKAVAKALEDASPSDPIWDKLNAVPAFYMARVAAQPDPREQMAAKKRAEKIRNGILIEKASAQARQGRWTTAGLTLRDAAKAADKSFDTASIARVLKAGLDANHDHWGARRFVEGLSLPDAPAAFQPAALECRAELARRHLLTPAESIRLVADLNRVLPSKNDSRVMRARFSRKADPAVIRAAAVLGTQMVADARFFGPPAERVAGAVTAQRRVMDMLERIKDLDPNSIAQPSVELFITLDSLDGRNRERAERFVRITSVDDAARAKQQVEILINRSASEEEGDDARYIAAASVLDAQIQALLSEVDKKEKTGPLKEASKKLRSWVYEKTRLLPGETGPAAHAAVSKERGEKALAEIEHVVDWAMQGTRPADQVEWAGTLLTKLIDEGKEAAGEKDAEDFNAKLARILGRALPISSAPEDFSQRTTFVDRIVDLAIEAASKTGDGSQKANAVLTRRLIARVPEDPETGASPERLAAIGERLRRAAASAALSGRAGMILKVSDLADRHNSDEAMVIYSKQFQKISDIETAKWPAEMVFGNVTTRSRAETQSHFIDRVRGRAVAQVDWLAKPVKVGAAEIREEHVGRFVDHVGTLSVYELLPKGRMQDRLKEAGLKIEKVKTRVTRSDGTTQTFSTLQRTYLLVDEWGGRGVVGVMAAVPPDPKRGIAGDFASHDISRINWLTIPASDPSDPSEPAQPMSKWTDEQLAQAMRHPTEWLGEANPLQRGRLDAGELNAMVQSHIASLLVQDRPWTGQELNLAVLDYLYKTAVPTLGIDPSDIGLPTRGYKISDGTNPCIVNIAPESGTTHGTLWNETLTPGKTYKFDLVITRSVMLDYGSKWFVSSDETRTHRVGRGSSSFEQLRHDRLSREGTNRSFQAMETSADGFARDRDSLEKWAKSKNVKMVSSDFSNHHIDASKDPIENIHENLNDADADELRKMGIDPTTAKAVTGEPFFVSGVGADEVKEVRQTLYYEGDPASPNAAITEVPEARLRELASGRGMSFAAYVAERIENKTLGFFSRPDLQGIDGKPAATGVTYEETRMPVLVQGADGETVRKYMPTARIKYKLPEALKLLQKPEAAPMAATDAADAVEDEEGDEPEAATVPAATSKIPPAPTPAPAPASMPASAPTAKPAATLDLSAVAAMAEANIARERAKEEDLTRKAQEQIEKQMRKEKEKVDNILSAEAKMAATAAKAKMNTGGSSARLAQFPPPADAWGTAKDSLAIAVILDRQSMTAGPGPAAEIIGRLEAKYPGSLVKQFPKGTGEEELQILTDQAALKYQKNYSVRVVVDLTGEEGGADALAQAAVQKIEAAGAELLLEVSSALRSAGSRGGDLEEVAKELLGWIASTPLPKGEVGVSETTGITGVDAKALIHKYFGEEFELSEDPQPDLESASQVQSRNLADAVIDARTRTGLGADTLVMPATELIRAGALAADADAVEFMDRLRKSGQGLGYRQTAVKVFGSQADLARVSPALIARGWRDTDLIVATDAGEVVAQIRAAAPDGSIAFLARAGQVLASADVLKEEMSKRKTLVVVVPDPDPDRLDSSILTPLQLIAATALATDSWTAFGSSELYGEAFEAFLSTLPRVRYFSMPFRILLAIQKLYQSARMADQSA